MRGVVMHKAGDVRVEEREDPKIIEPTDAIIRITATCICGSDLWPYRGVEPVDHTLMGHEYVGVVEEIGAAVQTVSVGDFVVGSFAVSDNTCEICRAGYQSRCLHGSFVAGDIGTQAEKARSRTPTERWWRRPVSRRWTWFPRCWRPRMSLGRAGSPPSPPRPDPVRPWPWSVTVPSA